MQYRNFGNTGKQVSVLSYGCMRYPKENGRVNEKRAASQVYSAIEAGVNYLDTAYIYGRGNNETITGSILKNGWRNKVMLATKLPPYLAHSQKDMEIILDTQLKRLQTDHIEFYLMHALNDLAGWEKLKNQGILEFIERSKKEGKIGHIGFSFHGDTKEFKRLIDDYPWEFTQIQYNFLDENYQAGREGLEYASQKGMGISIMEPLRGGTLAGQIPKSVEKIWRQSEVKRSPAEWALRWLWNHPEVHTVLSGMNEESHIEENLKVASEALPMSLTSHELQLIQNAKLEYMRLMKVNCTGCNYCMPCPVGVNIPLCLGFYNSKHLFGGQTAFKQYTFFTRGIAGGESSNASLCVECGKCEKVCPQHIEIIKELKMVVKELEPIYVKPVLAGLKTFIKMRDKIRKGKV